VSAVVRGSHHGNLRILRPSRTRLMKKNRRLRTISSIVMNGHPIHGLSRKGRRSTRSLSSSRLVSSVTRTEIYYPELKRLAIATTIFRNFGKSSASGPIWSATKHGKPPVSDCLVHLDQRHGRLFDDYREANEQRSRGLGLWAFQERAFMAARERITVTGAEQRHDGRQLSPHLGEFFPQRPPHSRRLPAKVGHAKHFDFAARHRCARGGFARAFARSRRSF
jgi:hypothetical protein